MTAFILLRGGHTAVVDPHPPPPKRIHVTATAYTAYCLGCSGVTATGIDLRAHPDRKVIAVDHAIIPLGSRVYVDGYGYAVAGDIGGGIDGREIDVFVPRLDEALKWGRRDNVTVTIINEGGDE